MKQHCKVCECNGISPVSNRSCPISEALKIAKTMVVDGDHHKMWVIDQMVRKLCGDEATYELWVQNHNSGEHGPNTYEWECGVAP